MQMGFSLVAAAAIIGVSILVVIGTFTGSLLPAVTDISDSYEDMRDRIIDKIQTDIDITTVSTPANGSNYDLNITLENTGSITLKTSDFSILINGTLHPFTCSNSYIYPENNVYFNVTNLSGTGQRRLKVVAMNGVSDYYDYTIT